jgi:hypothetical protein
MKSAIHSQKSATPGKPPETAFWARVARCVREVSWSRDHRFAKGFRRFAKGFLIAAKQELCKHEFELRDLHLTGISEPKLPSNGSGCQAFVDFQNELARGEAFTKRVVWPCSNCGKKFYAHCGLDISPKYGPIKKHAENNSQLTTRLKLGVYSVSLRLKRCSMPCSGLAEFHSNYPNRNRK